MDFRNKKVTVVGLGASGMGSAMLLDRAGAIVSVTDNNDNENIRKNASFLREKYIEIELGKHSESFLKETELLVVSPGVEKTSLPINYATSNNIPIISEVELGYLFCEGLIVAITGTNGKSTVVSLIGEILNRAGITVNVCGNIGNAFSCEMQNINKDTVVVLETSSFQLEWIELFRPKISVILNVTEDHLDRYRDFQDYFNAKKRIYKNQSNTDIIILNHDDASLKGLAKSERIAAKVLYFSTKAKVEGIYFDRGNINISLKNKVTRLFNLKESKLKGEHNIENILVSILIARLLKADTDSIKEAVKDFAPLDHRFEAVATINGVGFIDDSKATNVDSTYRALESLEKKSILILGGKDKNLAYEKIVPLVKNKVKKIILIGETKNKMRNIFKDVVPLEETDSLEEAVMVAYKSAKSGDFVLLSPMCSSFDMFRDYKERGEVFKGAVTKIKNAK